MSYQPVSGIVPQYSNDSNELASGYYLKFYVANTTTPLSMATDSTGNTLLVKCKLNPDGLPISNPLDNDTVFIPHVSQAYRLVIYRNEADADANNTGGAFLNVPNVKPLASSNSVVIRVSSRTEMKGYDVSAGYQFSLEEGGRSGIFVVKSGTPPTDSQEGIYVVLNNGNYAMRRIEDNFIYLCWYGVQSGDNINTVYPEVREACISLGKDLIIGEGIFFGDSLELIPGQFIFGLGENKTFVDAQSVANDVFISPAISDSTLTQTEDFLSGDTTININNSLSPGDMFRITSTDRATERWDGGTVIRADYVKGEILKIKEATSTSLTFYEPAYFDYPLSSANAVSAFTPNFSGGIFNLTVKRDRDTTTSASGIRVDRWENFKASGLGFENFNVAGLTLNRSYNSDIGEVSAKGGTVDLGLDYGISINDGCRYTKIKKAIGDNCRHVVAGGGTGYACPIDAKIDYVVATNSQSHSIDAHANCVKFHYGKVICDRGFSVAGADHRVDNLFSSGGQFSIGFEGSYGVSLGNIVFTRCNSIYSDVANISAVADYVELNFPSSYTLGLPQGHALDPASYDIQIKKLKIINTSIQDGDDTSAADDSTGGDVWGFIMPQDSRIDFLEIEGYPVGVLLKYDGCSIGDLKTKNCGWSSTLDSAPTAIKIGLGASGAGVEKITDYYGLTSTGLRLLRLDDLDTGTPKNITIKNARSIGPQTRFYGAFASESFSEVRLDNVRPLFGGGGNSVSCTGKFIFNTIVADN